MKKDKILEAYEDLLNELYTVGASSVGRSQSGSKGQRASNVALTCPTCGEFDDHHHEGLEKGAKCPKCGQIVEAYEEMFTEDVAVDKITTKAVADVKKIIMQAAKTASQQSGKPEGRLSEWIQGKVKAAMKQWR